ncbi:MAG: globin domain-containing protein [Polyangiales bacterium]
MALDVALLRSSFEIVVERAPDLTARFYQNFFTLYPQVKPMFSRNSPERQQQMLTQALVAVLDHLEDAPWLASTLRALGAKHVAYGVRDEMYAWVGESLLLTLEQVAGKDWSPALARAWSDAIGAIAGLMIEGAKLERSESETTLPDSIRA